MIRMFARRIEIIAIVLLVLMPCKAFAEPSLVIIVRHAERSLLPEGDPSLSGKGHGRAVALADALEWADISAIVTTHLRRTRETAEPLAQKRGITPQIVDVSGRTIETHIADVAAVISQQIGQVLVVGHSNTVTKLVAALGGPVLPDLCENSFGVVFVLVPEQESSPLVQLRYGQSDPAPAGNCM